MEMSQGAFTQTVEKQIDKARSNARMNKIMISFFVGLLAVVHGTMVWGGFTGAFGTPPELQWITVALTVSVFALLAFAFLVFWGIMVSTSFISTGAPSIGLHLPLSQSDTGKLALLGYIRLFDAQIFTIIIAFPLSYFFATWSITGSLACFGVFLITMGLAITVMLLLAIYFYSRIQSAGGSRLASIIRFLFIILYAAAIMGFSLSFQLINIIIPLIETFAILLLPIWHILMYVFPFSLGTFVVTLTNVPGMPLFWVDLLATLFYSFLAYLGIRWAIRFLVRIGAGGIIQQGPSVVHPTSIKVSGVGTAILRKDLRIALRTPGQAIMFFLPVLMMVPLLLQFIFEIGSIHVSDVIMFISIPTTMLAFFSIFFLSIEAKGMAFTLTLPLKTETILKSKARLITIMSISIPVFIFAISLIRPFTTPISHVIALSQVAVVYTSAVIALVFFTRVMGGGRLVGFEVSQHVAQMIVVGLLSAGFAFIPLILFGICWFFVSLTLLPIEIVHLAGLGGMWIGIILNYLIGKLLCKKILKN